MLLLGPIFDSENTIMFFLRCLFIAAVAIDAISNSYSYVSPAGHLRSNVAPSGVSIFPMIGQVDPTRAGRALLMTEGMKSDTTRQGFHQNDRADDHLISNNILHKGYAKGGSMLGASSAARLGGLDNAGQKSISYQNAANSGSTVAKEHARSDKSMRGVESQLNRGYSNDYTTQVSDLGLDRPFGPAPVAGSFDHKVSGTDNVAVKSVKTSSSNHKSDSTVDVVDDRDVGLEGQQDTQLAGPV
uniref:Uncharacterized protein n=2 Tax=Spongospora subterranea TaxID=70186 RepID=A0A0H5QY90_9EUKA|eukprot:CRZ06616.1 hypothetical protein [Spongospora subterranea]